MAGSFPERSHIVIWWKFYAITTRLYLLVYIYFPLSVAIVNIIILNLTPTMVACWDYLRLHISIRKMRCLIGRYSKGICARMLLSIENFPGFMVHTLVSVPRQRNRCLKSAIFFQLSVSFYNDEINQSKRIPKSAVMDDLSCVYVIRFCWSTKIRTYHLRSTFYVAI